MSKTYNVLFKFQFVLRASLMVGVALMTSTAHAQAVLRAFGNTGFELPVSPIVAPCYSELLDADVPSWLTTHPSSTGAQDNCNYPGASPDGGTGTGNPNVAAANNGTTYTGNLIELQAHVFQSFYSNRRVVSREGVQHAELSAKVNSTLYQQICLVPGEAVSWSFSHLGVQQVGTPDVMRFVIGDTVASIGVGSIAATAATGGIVNATTNTSGVGSATNCHQGSNVSQVTGCTVTQTTVNSPPGVSPAVSTTWADYSGSFTWTGAPGNKYIAFGAISPTLDYGNYIDRVVVTLKPYVEFASASASGLESVLNPTTIGIKVTGVVPTTMLVPITVTGGTATLGTDYNTPSGTATFNVTVPAGTYDGTTIISAGITINNDAILEGSETILLAIGVNSNYVISSTTICGAPPNNIITYTIIDNDPARISVNKISQNGTGVFPITVSNSTPAGAQPVTTTAANTSTTVANLANRAITTANGTTAITITEAVPDDGVTSDATNANDFFWGASAISCIDANGGILPGNTNPTTNIATLSGLVATIPAANVLATSNISCTLTNVLVNSVSDTASKTINLPSTTNVSTNDIYPTGSTFFSTGGTCVGRSPTTAGTANTTGIMSYTSPATVGGTCTVVYRVCAPAPNTTLCDDATLTVTGAAPAASVMVSKTDSKTVTASGSTNTYVVRLRNDGPDAANNVVLTDVVGSGLTCPGTNVVTCSVITGAAVCPAGTIANLTGAGITVATFPANSELQFSYNCTVN